MSPLSPLHLTFGESVRRWRQERGFSQERLGELVSLSTSMVGMIERGEKNTTLEIVQRLSDALSVETRNNSPWHLKKIRPRIVDCSFS